MTFKIIYLASQGLSYNRSSSLTRDHTAHLYWETGVLASGPPGESHLNNF